MEFEIFNTVGEHGRRWYFRAKGANHEIVCASEGYKSERAARKTIGLIKREAANAPIVDLGEM